jgi:hypothetical protein
LVVIKILKYARYLHTIIKTPILSPYYYYYYYYYYYLLLLPPPPPPLPKQQQQQQQQQYQQETIPYKVSLWGGHYSQPMTATGLFSELIVSFTERIRYDTGMNCHIMLFLTLSSEDTSTSLDSRFVAGYAL